MGALLIGKALIFSYAYGGCICNPFITIILPTAFLHKTGPFCGQLFFWMAFVHKTPLFCGQLFFEKTFLHKTGPFCGRNLKWREKRVCEDAVGKQEE